MDTIRNNAAGLSGLEQLRALMEAGTPPPIGVTLGFTRVEIGQGRVHLSHGYIHEADTN